ERAAGAGRGRARRPAGALPAGAAGARDRGRERHAVVARPVRPAHSFAAAADPGAPRQLFVMFDFARTIVPNGFAGPLDPFAPAAGGERARVTSSPSLCGPPARSLLFDLEPLTVTAIEPAPSGESPRTSMPSAPIVPSSRAAPDHRFEKSDTTADR